MKTIILFGLVLGALSAAGEVFIADVGGKVLLECGVNSFKSRVDWNHDTLVLRAVKNGFPSRGNSPISKRAKTFGETGMEISSVAETDVGKFTCVVDGKVNEHHLVVVSVSVPSEALVVGTEATLNCDASSGLSGQNSPTAQWQKLHGSIHPSKTVRKPVALSDKGTWQCIVSYQGKQHIKNVTINVKEADPEPTTPTLQENSKNPKSKNGKNSTGGFSNQSKDMKLLLGLVWWIWAAIGAGGLVVIILIIVITVMYKRNRRRKRKFLRMKRAQLSQKPKKYCQCVRQTAAAKPQQGRRREKPSALPLQPLLQEGHERRREDR